MARVDFFSGDRGGTWRYDPARPLGPPGGFGQVFEGEDREGAPVAVKEVPPRESVSPRLRIREKEIADKLQSVDAQHLIPVLDTALAGDKLLLVMERADMSLSERIGEEAPLPENEAVEIMRHVASGLRELHSAAIIHRDLKPGNILLHDEKWKLSDFGIARDADLGTQDPTFVGAGSYAYMPPEKRTGQSPTIKTDLYSLGCLFFEILAGSPPFGGPDAEDYSRQHQQEEPPDLTGGDAVLKRLVIRLLMKDPTKRPQDARAVEEDLTNVDGTDGGGSGKLAVLALEYAEEESREDAKRIAREAEEANWYRLRRQAFEDLDDLFYAATIRIQRQGLEVEYTRSDAGLTIVGSYAKLEAQILPNFRSPVEADSLVVLGEIVGGNVEGFRTR